MGASEQRVELTERLTLTGLGGLAKVRETVRRMLADCPQEDVIDAVLVADELGTLACEYGALPAAVSLIRSYQEPSLRVAVTAPHLTLAAVGGRSRTAAHVLQACATDWGIGNRGGRRTLWACVTVRADLPSWPVSVFPKPRVPVS